MASVTVSFGGEVVGEYPIDKPVCVVGRDASCEVHIDNLGVSRTHCQFIKRGQAYVLQDMNSANGTYVNGKRVGEHYLNDGDEILIGKHTLKYSAHGVAAPPAEQQAPTDDQMQDALHTYVMDGARIRERLAEMGGAPVGGPEAPPAPEPTAQKQPGTSRLEPVVPPGPSPRTAKDHALDFDPLKPQSRKTAVTPPKQAAGGIGGGIKIMLYFSLLMNAILIGLIILVILFMMKNMQRGTSDPNRAPAPSYTPPAPAPAAAPGPAAAPAPAPAPEKSGGP
jgi:pSer/pThr/pTyr-binding forkhead associated (FHA) protein